MASTPPADIEALLKPYEDRASEAEARLTSLESMVQSLGIRKGGDKEHKAAHDFEPRTELVASLTALRATLERARTEQERLTVERDEVRSERDVLRKALEKEKYHVLHLCRALDEKSAKAAEAVDELVLLKRERQQPKAPPIAVDTDVSVF